MEAKKFNRDAAAQARDGVLNKVKLRALKKGRLIPQMPDCELFRLDSDDATVIIMAVVMARKGYKTERKTRRKRHEPPCKRPPAESRKRDASFVQKVDETIDSIIYWTIGSVIRGFCFLLMTSTLCAIVEEFTAYRCENLV